MEAAGLDCIFEAPSEEGGTLYVDAKGRTVVTGVTQMTRWMILL